MAKHKILTLVGGISRGSINQRLYRAIKKAAPADIEFSDFDISTLPFFSQDIEVNTPELVKNFKALIDSADGILIITPEYNRSIPGVLKNALDWGTRPSGKNSLNNKKAAILGMSAGKTGTMSAQGHLRAILVGCGVYTMPKPEMYLYVNDTMGEGDDFGSEKTKEYVLKFLKSFSDFIS